MWIIRHLPKVLHLMKAQLFGCGHQNTYLNLAQLYLFSHISLFVSLFACNIPEKNITNRRNRNQLDDIAPFYIVVRIIQTDPNRQRSVENVEQEKLKTFADIYNFIEVFPLNEYIHTINPLHTPHRHRSNWTNKTKSNGMIELIKFELYPVAFEEYMSKENYYALYWMIILTIGMLYVPCSLLIACLAFLRARYLLCIKNLFVSFVADRNWRKQDNAKGEWYIFQNSFIRLYWKLHRHWKSNFV